MSDQPSEWAAARLALAEDIPAYGSAAWHALADDHPMRLLSAIAAAELHQQAVTALAAAVDVIAGLDDELHERQTVRRRAADRVKRLAGASVDDTVRRLTGREPSPRPMVQTADWPKVKAPGAVEEQPDPRPARLPSTSEMIRRVS